MIFMLKTTIPWEQNRIMKKILYKSINIPIMVCKISIVIFYMNTPLFSKCMYVLLSIIEFTLYVY